MNLSQPFERIGFGAHFTVRPQSLARNSIQLILANPDRWHTSMVCTLKDLAPLQPVIDDNPQPIWTRAKQLRSSLNRFATRSAIVIYTTDDAVVWNLVGLLLLRFLRCVVWVCLGTIVPKRKEFHIFTRNLYSWSLLRRFCSLSDLSISLVANNFKMLKSIYYYEYILIL